MKSPSPNGSRSLRQEQIRARVLDVAYRMFAENGFEGTTMTDIAEASGVPRRTLFRHFASKEHVALAYHDTILNHLVERLAARPDDEGGAVALMNTLLTYTEELSIEQAMELSELLVRNPELRAHNLERYIQIEHAAAKVIEPRCRSEDAALEADLAAGAVVTAWRIANERWFEQGRKGHPKTEAARTFALLTQLWSD